MRTRLPASFNCEGTHKEHLSLRAGHFRVITNRYYALQQVDGNAGGVVTFRMSAAQAQSADVRQACSYLVPILRRTLVVTSRDEGSPPSDEGATRSNAAVDAAATVGAEKGPLDTTQGSRSMKVDYVQRNYPYLTGKGVKIGRFFIFSPIYICSS